jgi:hypothetical protein
VIREKERQREKEDVEEIGRKKMGKTGADEMWQKRPQAQTWRDGVGP